MEESKKKTNFFKQVFKSIKDLDKYEDFANELPKEAIKYLTKLALIFAMIVTLFYSFKIVESLNNIYENLKVQLPDFSYSNEKLNVAAKQPMILNQFEDTIGKIIIDTNIKENELELYKDEIKNSNSTILILEDKVVITANNMSGQVVYKYSEIMEKNNIKSFNKADVIKYVDNMNVFSIYATIYFIMFIYLFIIYFIAILMDVLILAILAIIISRMSRIKLKFAPCFNIAVHGVTLSVLLNLMYIIVNLLTGFNIKYFNFMYNAISYIYVVVAILMIKTDFINRQIELMKIVEEQEKVRQELEKQKEEKNKKQEEKKENKPKDKKKKEKDDNGEIEGEVNPSVIQEKQ